MSWKCAKCGVNEVSYEGGICEMCEISVSGAVLYLQQKKK